MENRTRCEQVGKTMIGWTIVPLNLLVAVGYRMIMQGYSAEGSLRMTNTSKTAIVTGASRGIGAGLVEAFLKRGYNVVANSRNITTANPFAAAANVALVDGDIGHPGTAAMILDTAISRFGRIDVLINNAGAFIPKPFREYTTEDFNTLVSTTLAGFL